MPIKLLSMTRANPKYERLLAQSMLAFFLIRLIPASLLNLGNDEVYYTTYPLHMQWNYFDHPPMVALWIRAFTANLHLRGEIFNRLGSMLGAALCTWILFRIGCRIHSARAGWLAAMLYNVSFYSSVIAGVFIMPDSPQMVFWCWSLLQMVKIIENEKVLFQWALLGLSSGLGMMSKVHTIFLWIGILLFMLFKRKEWFRLFGPYLALLICVLIFFPLIWWNIKNNFITYRYHSARLIPLGYSLNYLSFFRELGGAIFYNNPLNVAIIFSAIFMRKSKACSGLHDFRCSDMYKALSLFKLIALPLIIVLVVVSLFRDTLPHWSGPAYVSLMPMAGVWLAEQEGDKLFPGLLKYAMLLFGGVLSVALILTLGFPGTLGKKDARIHYGQNDFTLDLYGWKQAGNTFAQLRAKAIYGRLMPASAPLVASKWFPGAHEEFYVCRPLGMRLVGLGSLEDLHHFVWLNHWSAENQDMNLAWCMIPSNYPADPHALYGAYYTHIDSLTSFPVYRNGQVSRFFSVYILKGFIGNIPQVKTQP